MYRAILVFTTVIGVQALANNEPSAPVEENGSAPVRTDPGSGMCNAQDIHFTEDGFRAVLSGDCANIVISASNGRLNVDKARSIRVEGNQVVVLNKEVESLVVSGNHNTLNMTKVAVAEVSGNHNGLLGREYRRVIFSGEDNYVNTNNQPVVEDSGRKNRVR